MYAEEVIIVPTGKKTAAKKAKWIQIQTRVDGYKGWVPRNSVCTRKSPYLLDDFLIVKVNQTRAHIYGLMDTTHGFIISVPFGTRLKVLEEPDDAHRRWIKIELLNKKSAFIQRGDVTMALQPISMDQIVEFSQRFLNITYTWGGRSSFGFDCSGFCQMLYREMGILLPRDAKDQMAWAGFEPVAIDQVGVGDLIFFGLAEDKIRHVGMMIERERFIHTSPRELQHWLRISSLQDHEWSGSAEFSFRAARRIKAAS